MLKGVKACSFAVNAAAGIVFNQTEKFVYVGGKSRGGGGGNVEDESSDRTTALGAIARQSTTVGGLPLNSRYDYSQPWHCMETLHCVCVT